MVDLKEKLQSLVEMDLNIYPRYGKVFMFSFLLHVIHIFFLTSAPAAFGSSWAMGRIEATVAGLHHSHNHSRAIATWDPSHVCNTGSLTH